MQGIQIRSSPDGRTDQACGPISQVDGRRCLNDAKKIACSLIFLPQTKSNFIRIIIWLMIKAADDVTRKIESVAEAVLMIHSVRHDELLLAQRSDDVPNMRKSQQ